MAQEIYHRSNWGNPTETWGNTYLNADLTNELYKRASEYENSWVTDQLLNGVGIKPSIILTPTAYEDGILNSVKPAKTFGSELVTNGTFDTDLSGWQITNSDATHTVTHTSDGARFQSDTTTPIMFFETIDIILQGGRKYSLTVEIVNRNSGALKIQGNNINLFYTDNGVFTDVIEPTGDSKISFYRNTSNVDITIKSVSVKEIIDADFDFTRGSSATRVNEQGLVEDVQILSGELVQNGDFEQIGSELVVNGGFDTDSDWTLTQAQISDGTLKISTSDGSFSGARQFNTFTVGKNYLVSLEISDIVGTIEVDVNGGSNYGQNFTTNGVHSFYLYATNTDIEVKRSFGAEQVISGTIDNVSVKEVGQNWTFQNGWNMGDGVAVYSGTVSAYRKLYQENILTIGKIYKLTFDIVSINSGSIKNFSQSSPTSYSTIGTKTEYFTATYDDLFLEPTTDADLTIDNVSIVEVTDDTDLPRINYTNFDYEDVLGDELASPLDFTSDWTSTGATSITENSFQTSGSGIGIYFSLEADKKYKIKVSNVSGDISIRYRTSNGGAGTVAGNFDEFIIINTFGSTTPNVYLRANSETTVTVGDVTIKELTEDVVVPYSGEGSLKLEPQSTNLMPYSEDFTQWTNSTTNLDVPSNVTQTNPSGGSESGFININNGVSASKFIYEPISTTSSIHTQSVFFKYHSRQWIQLVSGGTSHYANFDIQNGVVGNVSGCTATIEDYGNGWYKCTATLTSAATPINIAIVVLDDDATTRIPTSTGTGSYYVWGAQSEALSYATSYIPTNGSTVTRLADVCNNSGNSDLINSTEGVLYAEISALADDGTNRILGMSNGGDFNNSVLLRFSSASNRIQAQVRLGGVYQCSLNYDVTDATEFNKIAFKYKQNDFSLYVNGVERATDTSGNVITGLDVLDFDISTTNEFYGNVKCVAVFKETLSDTELEKLTTI